MLEISEYQNAHAGHMLGLFKAVRCATAIYELRGGRTLMMARHGYCTCAVALASWALLVASTKTNCIPFVIQLPVVALPVLPPAAKSGPVALVTCTSTFELFGALQLSVALP
jgi:hypothetical protein